MNSQTPWYKRPKTQKNYLKISAFVVFSFAPVFFFGTMSETATAAHLTLDLLSWPLDGNMPYNSATTRFLSALTGGFLLGWGVLIWMLSSWVYDKAPNETRKSVLVGVLAWFLLDSTGSVASGNASNVLFNVLILLVAVGPLWWAPEKA